MRDGFSALMWELSCVTPAAHRLWLTVGAVRDSSHQKLFEVCWTSYYSTLCASWTTGQQISPGNSLLSPDWLQTILLFCFCRHNLHLYTLGRRSLICSYLGIYNWLTDWNWFESFWSPWALELQSQCLFSLPEDPLLDDVATWCDDSDNSKGENFLQQNGESRWQGILCSPLGVLRQGLVVTSVLVLPGKWAEGSSGFRSAGRLRECILKIIFQSDNSHLKCLSEKHGWSLASRLLLGIQDVLLISPWYLL